MSLPDLGVATAALAQLVRETDDEDLSLPTPCPAYDVGGLIAHVHGLSQAFAAAGAKNFGPLTSTAPSTDVRPPDDWRETTPEHLDALGRAWSEAEAWTGMTAAGGVEMPGEIAGLVALDEVVLHGWDIARSTGKVFDPGTEALETIHGFLVESRKEPVDAELFGPVVDVPESAPLFDRVVGLAGRDPAWTG